MAIVGDYMVYGNCSVCGKYLSKGTLCCNKLVQSNYGKWWEEMSKAKENQQPALVLHVKKRSIGTGIQGIKDIMESGGKEYYEKIVKHNNALKEGKLK